MPQRASAAQPHVEIAGRTFDEPSTAELMEVVVDTDLTAVSSCTITILDMDRVALDGVDYRSPVKIKAPSLADDGDNDLHDLFVGEVYGMEFEADERGTYSRITAFDQTYRLKQDRVTKARQSVTDSDIAGEIAKAAGLRVGRVDRTAVVHEHIGQINQTNWDFLRERAAANGFEVFIADGALNFRKPDEASTGPDAGGHTSQDPLQLTSGKNLFHLRTRTTAAQQVGEVEVRGWDPAQKKEVVSTAAAATSATKLATSAVKAADRAGGATRITGRAELASQAACDALATALSERTASTFSYAEGTAVGDPRLLAGAVVSVGESGRFDGQYLLTRARHTFRPGDYQTTFTVSGSHDRTRFGLRQDVKEESWYGTYPALVTSVKDPKELGRVRLQFPWLDPSYESDWARVVQIGAGDQEGLLWFPEVNDEVLVSFMRGDARFPTVIGGMYNGKDKPPFPDHIGPDGKIEIRGMRSGAGHQVVFFDKPGEERIEIASSAGSCTIVLDEVTKTVTVESKGDVQVKSGAKVEVQASGDVTVTSGANVTVEATANVEIKAGANLTLSASGVVEIKGSLVKLN